MQDFSERLLDAAQASILDRIQKGDWLEFDYQKRIRVDSDFLSAIYAGLDRDRIKRLVREHLEEKIAEKIIHAMATEIGTDVKSVVTNQPLRENLRFMIRDAIRDAAKPIVEPKS